MKLKETDLSFTGFGRPWGHSRSFDNVFMESHDGINGMNWYVSQAPFLLAYGGVNPGTLVMVTSGYASLWFDRLGATDHFGPRFQQKSSIVHYPGDQEYVFADSGGQQTVFFDFTVPNTAGMFKGLIDANGNRALTTYDASHRLISLVQDQPGGDTGFLYEYAVGQSAPGKLASVTLMVRGAPVRRARYTYYGLDDRNGLEWDLKSATVEVWDNGSSEWRELRRSHYRYYTADGAQGFAHGLKIVVGPEASVRMLEAGLSPETATDAEVAGYADYFFIYDWQRRVIYERVMGGGAFYAFTYEENPAPGEGFNAWTTKTTETLPDGSQNIAYANRYAQVLFKIFQSGSEQWFTAWQMDDQGRRTMKAESSAIAGYDEAQPGLAILKPQEGLIRLSEYYPLGNPKGEPAGYLASESLKKGRDGSPILLRSWEYATRALGFDSIHPVASETLYQSETGDLAPATTEWIYDAWYDETFQVKQRTTVLPAIPENQNGSGIANRFSEIFDLYNNRNWLRNERQFLQYATSDPATGAILQSIIDVDTSVLPAPNGWTTPAGGGLHLVTDLEHDELGRQTQSLGPWHEIDLAGVGTPTRKARWTVYLDAANRQMDGNGYATGGESQYLYTLVNPIDLIVLDHSGRVTDRIQAVRSSTAGRLVPTDTLPQSSWTRRQQSHYDDQGLHVWDRRYVSLLQSIEGLPGVNYNETSFAYDTRGRQIRITSPGGTVQITVLSSRGWPLESWVGTDATGATLRDPSGSGTVGNDMVVIMSQEYDDGTGGGNGNLTRETVFVSADDLRSTSYGYDFRNRRITKAGEVDHFEIITYDNADQTSQVDHYNAAADGKLIGRQQTGYDDLGRVFARKRFAVDVESGNLGNAVSELTWYDPSGNSMRVRPMEGRGCSKRSYDGLNRVIKTYLATDPSAGTYTLASSVANDTVVNQTELTYDASGSVILTLVRQRFHDATGLGELNGPSGSQPRARVSCEASYPDALGRAIVVANFGTNGGDAVIRPTSPPASTDTVLVSRSTYNERGELCASTDPADKMDLQAFDDAGQLLETIENYREIGSGVDVNKTTRFEYNGDGRMRTLTAFNVSTGDQVTRWVYGTRLGESQIASGALLWHKVYPDGGILRCSYDRTGALTTRTDQNGTVHTFLYDKLGRQTDDCVIILGTKVDAVVRRISRTYEVRGMVTAITSMSMPTPGVGEVVNHVQFGYNDFGQEITEYQEHSGMVVPATTPCINYTYADGTGNTTRRQSTIYPDGREIGYTYGTPESSDDLLNRVTAITDGGIPLVQYARLGTDTFVRVQYQEPGYGLTVINQPSGSTDGGDQYTGLDRFNRPIDILWATPGATPVTLERVQYGFDRCSNRLWRKHAVAPSGGFDEEYAYDGLYQLEWRKRGTLHGGTISQPNEEERFTYDPTGNWIAYQLLEYGTLTVDENRTHNTSNRITAIDGSGLLVAYDPAGNMVMMPKVNDSTTGQELAWDAWNRLVGIKEGSAIVSEYQYDGLARRVQMMTSPEVGGSETRHFYYSDQWQVLEERVDVANVPDRQFVFGIRSIDDIVLRDRVATTSTRLYALKDQWSITGVTGASGNVEERFAYRAFGKSTVLGPDFDSLSESALDWETRFACYRFDEACQAYQVRYRSLHPQLGRWLSQDLVDDGGATNLYSYVDNNSIQEVDPFGLETFAQFTKRCEQHAKRKCDSQGRILVSWRVELAGGGLHPGSSGWTIWGRFECVIECGACSEAEKDRRQLAKNAACREGDRSCKPTDNCAKIARCIRNGIACVNARRAVMDCFNGGNQAHIDEMNTTLATLALCGRKFVSLGC